MQWQTIKDKKNEILRNSSAFQSDKICLITRPISRHGPLIKLHSLSFDPPFNKLSKPHLEVPKFYIIFQLTVRLWYSRKNQFDLWRQKRMLIQIEQQHSSIPCGWHYPEMHLPLGNIHNSISFPGIQNKQKENLNSNFRSKQLDYNYVKDEGKGLETIFS